MSTSQTVPEGINTAIRPDAPIEVPYPEEGDLHLRIAEGACRLNVAPGGGEMWICGTRRDPSGLRPLRIIQEGGTVSLTEEPSVSSVWEWLRTGHGIADVPVVDLSLGKAKPFRLTIEVGASENKLDLGGVPIRRLVLKHGAGKTELDFSAPKIWTMTLMEISAGAGSTDLRHLANAGAAEMLIEGGMGAFTLDFGGVLRQDAHARINAALSSVTIVVPADTAAKVSAETPLGHVEIGEGLAAKDGAFWTPAALAGRTPTLTISASVALGLLTLRTS